MNGPEKSVQDFLRRWLNRKLTFAKRSDEESKVPAGEAESAEQDPPVESSPDASAAAFDPASLPPIESINAASDVCAFLRPGVPIELTRAALRRAWATDPAIRDFVGLAENQWDFTQPDTVPGFGSLESTAELRRILAGLFDRSPAWELQVSRTDDSDTEGACDSSGKAAAPDCAAISSPENLAASPIVAAPQIISDKNTAAQDDVAVEQATAQRKHGRALPK